MEIFKEVKEELMAACTYNVVERLEDGDKLLYKIKVYSNPKKEFSVVYDTVNTKLLCGCHLFESRGIPCSHIFVVLKNEFMANIPNSLICKRWTKTAKSELVCSDRLDEIDSDVMKSAHFGAVASIAHKLCDIAATKRELFLQIRDDVSNLAYKYGKLVDARGTQNSSLIEVGDPTVVKTKGAPRKKGFGRKRRRCRNCNNVGHTVRRCPIEIVTT